jgi:hypothetical protein
MGQKEKNRMNGSIKHVTTQRALCYRFTMPCASHLYEIEYKGKIIRCRNLQAMQAALSQLEGGRLVREETPWTAGEFQKFTGRIHIPQRRLLAKLLDNGPDKSLEDTALRDLLGLPDNKSLAGSLSGISKVALMFDITPRRVYTVNTIYRHSRPYRTYQVTSEFAAAAAKHKWPSKQDLRDTP